MSDRNERSSSNKQVSSLLLVNLIVSDGYDVCLQIKVVQTGKDYWIPASTSMLVLNLKEEIVEQTGIVTTLQRLVFKGQVLKDQDPISTYSNKNCSALIHAILIGIEDGSTVYLATANSSRSHENGPENVSSESKSSQQPSLANNPELAMKLLQMDPRIKAMVERNPSLKHALTDPDTIKQILVAGSNPSMQKELMRGHERALANIEMMPGGFQALQQLYNQEMQAMDSAAASSRTRLRMTELDDEQSPNHIITEPMPNPWMPKKVPTKRMGRLRTSLLRSPETGGAPDPNWIQEMLGSLGAPSGSDLYSSADLFQPSALPDIQASPSQLPSSVDFDVTIYQERFRPQLEQMHQMGFDDTRENIRALLATGRNISSAIERLLGKFE